MVAESRCTVVARDVRPLILKAIQGQTQDFEVRCGDQHRNTAPGLRPAEVRPTLGERQGQAESVPSRVGRFQHHALRRGGRRTGDCGDGRAARALHLQVLEVGDLGALPAAAALQA